VYHAHGRSPGLAMSRSIGDLAAKCLGISPEPQVAVYDIDSSCRFVIMASDGLWEFVSSQEAVNLVDWSWLVNGPSAAEATRVLAREAKDRWREHEGEYCDDITVVVVNLQDTPDSTYAPSAPRSVLGMLGYTNDADSTPQPSSG